MGVTVGHDGHSETYRSGVSTLDVCYAVGNISDMSHQLQEPLHPSGDACDKERAQHAD